MNKIVLFFICAVSLVFLTAGGIQVMGKQQMNKDTLLQTSQELLSYTREEKLLISEYQKGHTTDAYLHVQTDSIDEKVNDFYNELQSDEVPKQMFSQVETLEPHVFAFSIILKQINQLHPGENIQQTSDRITKEEQFFQKEVQTYE